MRKYMDKPKCIGKKVFISGATPADPNNEVKPFRTMACEVTNEEFNAAYQEIRRILQGRRQRILSERPKVEKKVAGKYQPAVYVNATEARTFCELQKDKQGQPGRLPTGPEWIKMARGPQGFDHGTSNGTVECGKNACCETKTSCVVGSFSANEYGIHDATGNVYEWTQETDRRKETYMRGGSWTPSAPANLRANYGYNAFSTRRYDNLGFRCAWDVPAITTEPSPLDLLDPPAFDGTDLDLNESRAWDVPAITTEPSAPIEKEGALTAVTSGGAVARLVLEAEPAPSKEKLNEKLIQATIRGDL